MESAAETDDHGALSHDELREAWSVLSTAEKLEGFNLVARSEAEDLFLTMNATDQLLIVMSRPLAERRVWIRILPPDDAADVIQSADADEKDKLLLLLDDPTRKEVQALMAYGEDAAGGLMSPRYARVRPNMTVDEAISYLRKQARDRLETLYYAYVLDGDQKLLGVVSFRDLFAASSDKTVKDVMSTDVITVNEKMDQEAVSHLFAQHDLLAVPVVDDAGRMKGIVTVDDIVDVVEEEATEDIQKLGGTEALDEPYLQISLPRMIRKRAGWLMALFLSEMLTTTAMGFFEGEIQKFVALALFIPLVMSSGGNSGSQASTLVIRAMALGEVRLRDYLRVIRRELIVGLSLGCILGTIGLCRILLWVAVSSSARHSYTEHFFRLGIAIGFSLIGIVTWGSLSGVTLPFILRKLKFDPASASAPFVATLVDVTGLIIYFSVAKVVLFGVL